MINLEKLGYFLPQGYLFRQVSLQINKSDKVGLVGKNGAGKSTLLKILSGKTKPSEGNVHLPKGTVMGYLTQDIVIDSEQSVFEYLNCSNERIDFISTDGNILALVARMLSSSLNILKQGGLSVDVAATIRIL